MIQQGQIERVFSAYREAYKSRYGEYPLRPFPDDFEIFGKVISRIGAVNMAVKLVQHFVTMDGYKGYFKDQGHTLGCFNSNVDRVFSDYHAVHERGSKRELFVVGYSQDSGFPVCSHINQSVNPPFIPVTWNVWLKQSPDERLQGLNWAPNPVMEWRANWREWQGSFVLR